MSIIDFEHLKVTTMTVIVKLKGNVIIENVFPLLDITRLDLPKTRRRTKKFKIPFCNKPGAILSAKFKNITRGIVKSKSKRSFLNSITLDICTSKKNINAKLSGEIIQMCGPDSEELALETANHIIDHLLDIQEELDYINEDPEIRDSSIQWLIDNTVGTDYIIDLNTQEIIDLEDNETLDGNNILIDGKIKYKEIVTVFTGWTEGDTVAQDKTVLNSSGNPYIVVKKTGELEPATLDKNFFVEKLDQSYVFLDDTKSPINILVREPIQIMKVNSISIPKEYPSNYPEGIDDRIVNFYLKYCQDFSYHHVFVQFLESVKEIDIVATDDVEVEGINMAMINYSYSLGMSIDRWALANCINGLNGFQARYCNSTDHSVTISLPYNNNSKKKKNKPTRHTFMVHKSGIVTQSGPNVELMRGAYSLFRETIDSIKDKIRLDKPFNLKYRPIFPSELIKCQ